MDFRMRYLEVEDMDGAINAVRECFPIGEEEARNAVLNGMTVTSEQMVQLLKALAYSDCSVCRDLRHWSIKQFSGDMRRFSEK